MINTQALTLKLLLSCEDKDVALNHYEKINQEFFSGMYSSVFTAIVKYYQENGEIPSLSSLAIKFSRSTQLQTAVAALSQVDSEGIELDLAIDALRDEYAQQETLKLLQRDLLQNISLLNSIEIIETVAAIPLEIERKLQNEGVILDQSQIPLFQEEEEMNQTFINTGISNKWDNDFRGVAREEVILLGGRRGSGKSVVCANLVASQYLQKKIAPYYTIEMTARETLLRILAILAGVDALKTKNGTLEGEELYRLARVRAEMFKNGLAAYNKFIREKPEGLTFGDFSTLDKLLRKNHEIDHPLIIIDDPELKLSKIDVSLSKLHSLYGEKLTMGVVDYLNEVKLDGKTDPYDWVYQKEVATGLKNLARKHGIAIAAPYQIDESGEARFSKSILDPVDMAFIVTGNEKKGVINFASTKLRSLPKSVFQMRMDWRTLAIDPTEIPIEEEEEQDIRDMGQTTKESKGYKSKTKPKDTTVTNPKDDDLGADQYDIH